MIITLYTFIFSCYKILSKYILKLFIHMENRILLNNIFYVILIILISHKSSNLKYSLINLNLNM